ncbi:glutamate mutase L [Micromonospora sp. 4G57]|uniref:Glutamate mutase L n=1 Tax=Micromonospora sicca TaxID=2202420 RepID=A0ABU5J8L0_9ACTN|nr:MULTISPECIES: glutamate mutase L [unclassified Micromonospora]MDZ5443618.1 glutamate mutase L [Micromonospora sp. 4G57]MDZ5488910.1 glutamate mutase L [Micromonospora sp. 4G53]
MNVAVCADVGSTYTKAAVVDLDGGALVAAASAPTTVGTDVLHGLDAAVGAATARLGAADAPWYVCSSAGGGLRLAVIGYEPLVTAQAGRRVGLSAGANVVHVAAGRLAAADLTALRAARPDVVLLVGGTDGGDADTLTHNATRLARARWRVPVVLAGNADVRDDLRALLAAAKVPVTVADNVLPRIGVLAPASARAAIREVFLRHVIGGKRLSRGTRFARLVRAATPDAVLTGVEVLADALGGDLAVVDVGGATTDVYSVLTPDERDSGPGREVAGSLWRARTVEGDLGMRWSAPGVVRAAAEERLLAPAEQDDLAAAAAVRAAEPGFLPAGDTDRAVDARIAALAATVALRRHARGAATGERAGRDLRDVRLLVGSGGVLRHATPTDAAGVLGAVLGDHAGGWPLPRAARPVVDVDYVLAAGGLLAADHPAAARALLRRHLDR